MRPSFVFSKYYPWTQTPTSSPTPGATPQTGSNKKPVTSPNRPYNYSAPSSKTNSPTRQRSPPLNFTVNTADVSASTENPVTPALPSKTGLTNQTISSLMSSFSPLSKDHHHRHHTATSPVSHKQVQKGTLSSMKVRVPSGRARRKSNEVLQRIYGFHQNPNQPWQHYSDQGHGELITILQQQQQQQKRLAESEKIDIVTNQYHEEEDLMTWSLEDDADGEEAVSGELLNQVENERVQDGGLFLDRHFFPVPLQEHFRPTQTYSSFATTESEMRPAQQRWNVSIPEDIINVEETEEIATFLCPEGITRYPFINKRRLNKRSSLQLEAASVKRSDFMSTNQAFLSHSNELLRQRQSLLGVGFNNQPSTNSPVVSLDSDSDCEDEDTNSAGRRPAESLQPSKYPKHVHFAKSPSFSASASTPVDSPREQAPSFTPTTEFASREVAEQYPSTPGNSPVSFHAQNTDWSLRDVVRFDT